jgi:hypothetical protein
MPRAELEPLVKRCHGIVHLTKSREGARKHLEKLIGDHARLNSPLLEMDEPSLAWVDDVIKAARHLLRSAPPEILAGLQDNQAHVPGIARAMAKGGELMRDNIQFGDVFQEVPYRPKQRRDLQQAFCVLALALTQDPETAPPQQYTEHLDYSDGGLYR